MNAAHRKNAIHAVEVPQTSTFRTMIDHMNAAKQASGVSGFLVVVDGKRAVGVITDGDLRRNYGVTDLDAPITTMMVTDFIFVYEHEVDDQLARRIYRKIDFDNYSPDFIPRWIPVLTEDRKLVDVLDYFALLFQENAWHKHVAVIGGGVVGGVLTAAMLEAGFSDVTIIEKATERLTRLKTGHFAYHEPGVAPALSAGLRNGSFDAASSLSQTRPCDIFVICVGTPVIGEPATVQLDDVRAAALDIGAVLRPGSLVVLRSTVPVGTTRTLTQALTQVSNLVPGKDFHLIFAPERASEGNALNETRTVPQIIGGLTEQCVARGLEFFSRFVPQIVKVESLEAAELIKLANNTFRDLSFAFANELAMLADEFNINAHRLVEYANSGYPRNPIARPSPGVGGYCLPKDTVILSSSFAQRRTQPQLPSVSRRINEAITVRVWEKIASFFGDRTSIRVLIAGIAFKGTPDTDDTRNSPGLALAELAADAGATVLVFDPIVPSDRPELSRYQWWAETHGGDGVDCIVFMNDNPRFATQTWQPFMNAMNRPGLFCDPWDLFHEPDIASNPGITYATLGYIGTSKQGDA